jgi:hypothetical protein
LDLFLIGKSLVCRRHSSLSGCIRLQGMIAWPSLKPGRASQRASLKELAYRQHMAAVAAASLAIREGHEVHIGVPDRTSGNRTALRAKDQNW